MNTSATDGLSLLSGEPGAARSHLGARISVIELLLIIAVAAVLLGLSAPSFSRLMRSASVPDGSNALQSSLFLAHSKARDALPMGTATSEVGQSSQRAGKQGIAPESRCDIGG